MSIIKFAHSYLRKRQSPLVMSLHLIILCLVIFQIIVSNLMRVGDNVVSCLDVSGAMGKQPERIPQIADGIDPGVSHWPRRDGDPAYLYRAKTS